MAIRLIARDQCLTWWLSAAEPVLHQLLISLYVPDYVSSDKSDSLLQCRRCKKTVYTTLGTAAVFEVSSQNIRVGLHGFPLVTVLDHVRLASRKAKIDWIHTVHSIDVDPSLLDFTECPLAWVARFTFRGPFVSRRAANA